MTVGKEEKKHKRRCGEEDEGERDYNNYPINTYI